MTIQTVMLMLILIIDWCKSSDDECGSSKEDGESCECNCKPSKDKYESSASEYESSDEEFDSYGGFFYNEDMDVYCHPPFIASIKSSNSSTGLAINSSSRNNNNVIQRGPRSVRLFWQGRGGNWQKGSRSERVMYVMNHQYHHQKKRKKYPSHCALFWRIFLKLLVQMWIQSCAPGNSLKFRFFLWVVEKPFSLKMNGPGDMDWKNVFKL